MPSEKKRNHAGDDDPAIITLQLGVWRFFIERKAPQGILGMRTFVLWKEDAIRWSRYIWSFSADIIRLVNPWVFAIYIVAHMWKGLEQAFLLYFSSRLLIAIEACIVSGVADVWAVCSALAVRLFFVGASSVLEWVTTDLEVIFKHRMKHHFQRQILEAHLSLDLPTFKDNTSKPNIRPDAAWDAFSGLLESLDLAFSILSQFALVITFSRERNGGLLFAVLCVAKPLSRMKFAKDLWAHSFVGFGHNPHYLRLLAFYSIAVGDQYKQEVLSGSMEVFVEKEYLKAKDNLGDISDDYPSTLYSINPTPFPHLLQEFLGDLPLVYYALTSLMNPGGVSLTSLAMLQETSSSLKATFVGLSYYRTSTAENLKVIKEIYSGLKAENTIRGGGKPYPSFENLTEHKNGMGVELRNVSFKYPGVQDQLYALKDVSFNLKPSSLVVVVGTNGSGKSSIVKLLCNLYRPTSGSILIDGHTVEEYSLQDLRRATALLTQDHVILPLTVQENIAAGDPDRLEDNERVKEAAKLGGAYEFIEKLPSRWNQNLHDRLDTLWTSQHPVRPGPLKDAMDKTSEYVDISGGEKQRLVASRTFMRLMSEKIKLAVVDEPSSAMDPEGEYELFEQLCRMREGKTMVFVTHRFGHLTKHADLILCMKDGELLESGTHRELMEMNGEYSKLYNIQAQAFSEI